MPALTTIAPTLDSLGSARATTDRLFHLIQPDCLYERPISERHRVVFYRGHLEAFDWNLIGRLTLSLSSFHPEFDRLFAFGIDPGPDGLPTDLASDWPALEAVLEYGQTVREKLDSVWAEVPEERRHAALEHRLMHAETLTYMLHNFPLEKLVAPEFHPMESPAEPAPGSMLSVPAGAAVLGRAAGEGFGWDNEFQQHSVNVPAFSISKYKVTNGEYMEFVAAGAAPPHFWRQHHGEWYLRGVFREFALPLDWPVYVTQQQAADYAKWKGARLPTEAEWHRAASGVAPHYSEGNFDFRHWDPIPVHSTPAGDSAYGISQLSGNGWEWTSTVFGPFPGFEPFSFYPGYSAPFFDGEHYVMKGASPVTPAPFLRQSFRNWFRPNYRYAYSTFRCVQR